MFYIYLLATLIGVFLVMACGYYLIALLPQQTAHLAKEQALAADPLAINVDELGSISATSNTAVSAEAETSLLDNPQLQNLGNKLKTAPLITNLKSKFSGSQTKAKTNSQNAPEPQKVAPLNAAPLTSKQIELLNANLAQLTIKQENALHHAVNLVAINQVKVADLSEYELPAGRNILKIHYSSKHKEPALQTVELAIDVQAGKAYSLVFDGEKDSFKLATI